MITLGFILLHLVCLAIFPLALIFTFGMHLMYDANQSNRKKDKAVRDEEKAEQFMRDYKRDRVQRWEAEHHGE